jgi:hypothetical protein
MEQFLGSLITFGVASVAVLVTRSWCRDLSRYDSQQQAVLPILYLIVRIMFVASLINMLYCAAIAI